jgi:hypothetical protein
MDFLDISSLGVTYQYVVKIEQKFNKQNKREFRSENMKKLKYGKGGPNTQAKGQIKDGKPQYNHPNPPSKKGSGKLNKDTGKWCEFHKIPWHNIDECHPRSYVDSKFDT